MKIITNNDMVNKIRDHFNTNDFEIIEYKNVTSIIKIKCLKCGKEKKYSNCNNFLNKKILCECQSSYYINKNKILNLIKNNSEIEFIDFGYRKESKKRLVRVKCKNCNQIFEKSFQFFIKNQDCSFCKTKQKMNTKSYELTLPNEYKLIGEYTGAENKILIRHECGFIWKIKPHTLKNYFNNGYFGCPKCNHKRSKGEQKIENFLKDNKIKYENEKKFDWQSNSKYEYDFYLKDYNLIIEYNGQQHYIENNFFHGTLEQQQLSDKIKKDEAEKQGISYLIIPYYDFKKIEEILVQRLSLNGSSV